MENRRQREFRVQQDALRLAHRQYGGGVTSFLEVSDTERQLFVSELELARAQLAERLAVVQLYKAFGGRQL